jgi:uncharacterized repeat protein (TIGR03803 family)
VTNTLQQSISSIRLGTAGATLTFAVMLALAMVTTLEAQAQTFTVLHNFTGSPDGDLPSAGLMYDGEGNLYSTTTLGGSVGYGTVFKLDPTGTESVLYSFAGGSDGGDPYGGLVRDKAGNFYGTTSYGGNSGYGDGTVFKVSNRGEETVLFTFTGANGATPVAGLVRDSAGNLYGTTEWGGTSTACDYNKGGCGVVFELDKNGKETVLHDFEGGFVDGAHPVASLVLDTAGNLYCVNESGGADGYGMVFKLSKTCKETILHSFNGEDGAYPAGRLLLVAGNFYGTTLEGGASGAGTVFELDARGKETVLYSFTGKGGDGVQPGAGVVRDAAGNLYGTTYYGGVDQWGTVFKLDATGKETVLYSFSGGSDGGYPNRGVILHHGNLYGTASRGGTGICGQTSCGTVWKLNP